MTSKVFPACYLICFPVTLSRWAPRVSPQTSEGERLQLTASCSRPQGLGTGRTEHAFMPKEHIISRHDTSYSVTTALKTQPSLRQLGARCRGLLVPNNFTGQCHRPASTPFKSTSCRRSKPEQLRKGLSKGRSRVTYKTDAP